LNVSMKLVLSELPHNGISLRRTVGVHHGRRSHHTGLLLHGHGHGYGLHHGLLHGHLLRDHRLHTTDLTLASLTLQRHWVVMRSAGRALFNGSNWEHLLLRHAATHNRGTS